ncbi:phosphoesterase RecJ domain protein [Chloroherpeton thalassium ATCC 35110]|uniref:Phosphoesterase RecJ domain protein n=1 Tax=Chloroherpeton thalassium (strain ATCC 35110 / GB-78) TaxID=517418 RepID=B3QVE7_CHLT3|nr:bifunctional oligoribonuclease/PAP phosphatase NrnA [Chloroherpeton thalassium]ACF14547.1 phosphoesterase RecJ domain protein [Chloroherpeton thalassium ATCC 35110]
MNISENSHAPKISFDVWSPLFNLIQDATHIILSTHENADGDGLGSETAMFDFLTQLGKKVEIINPTHVPEHYKFLPPVREAIAFDAENSAHRGKLEAADLFLLLDTNHLSRTRAMAPILLSQKKNGKIKLGCIDHHLDEEDFADEMVCMSSASATGELIYNFLKYAGQRLTRDFINETTAIGLYTAIMTDTGSFRFPKTTAFVHQIIAELIGKGADPYQIYENVYNTVSLSALKLFGLAMNSIQLAAQGKVAYVVITQEIFKQTGTTKDDTERMVQQLMAIKTIDVGILFVELNNGGTKVSLRSRGDVGVNIVAQQFGGGGHKNASGCTMSAPPQLAAEQVLGKIDELLFQQNPKNESLL